ncbi:MAG: hypothetical protein CSA62_02330 [Planctomycetota bacterium]|nr:MAG: hypothetical protein CSA62_02330 [Planctomycetota bacterium]
MSLTGISIGGLASGLDTGAIIDALVKLERRPILALQERKVSFNRKKSLYKELGDKLEELQDKAKSLRLQGDLLGFKAKTNNDGFVSVSTSGNAVPGTYEIKVNSLAKAEVRTSSGHADKDVTGHGTGILWIEVGDNGPQSISLDSNNNTLEGIAAAINANGDMDVSASVVDTGKASNPYKLVITSKVTGEKGNITFSASPSDTALTSFVDDLNNNANRVVAAKNASIDYNGLTISRSSNSITDLIPGVTIDLIGEHGLKTNDPSSTKITVSSDSEVTSKKIKEFVDAYNAVVDFAKAQNKVTQNQKAKEGEQQTKASPLLGDSALRTVTSVLRSIVGNSVDTGNESYELLSQIGISSDRDGKLTFSQSKFDEALADDPGAIKNLFAQPDKGIGNQIYKRIDEWTDSGEGLLTARIKGLETSTRDVDKQITRLEERVEAFELRVTNQYAQLETLMNKLNSQRAALGRIG